MARRTVENFNGFVAARAPAATASSKKSATGRPKLASAAAAAVVTASGKKNVSSATTTTTSGKKNVPAPPAVTAAAATTTTTKKTTTEKRNSQINRRPSFTKVEKLQRKDSVEKNPGKKLPVNDKLKYDEIKSKQNEVIVDRVVELTDTADTITEDLSSDVDLEYEDDFEDYDSDFDSDTSIISLPTALQQIPVNPSSVVSGVKFALPVCVEEKLEPFLEEKFEVNSLERTVEMGLKNFKTAEKRKREQEIKDKIKTRGKMLMEMIKLDTVSYSLLDLPAIPYEQYIKMYGRSNMTQVQTQTHDDNAEKEVQTNDIDSAEKWTQRPIVLTNELDCSSPEYLKAKLGVGGTKSDVDRGPMRIGTSVIDMDRVLVFSRAILSMLDQQAVDRAEHRLMANNFVLGFSNGHLSPSVSGVEFLAKRPVTSVEFSCVTSTVESLVTTHEVMDSYYQYVICIWSISNTETPEYVLKCPNRVTSFCSVLKSTSGFVAAAHADGSICLWDLRESTFHHRKIDRLPCPLRSPSFNTALSGNQGHTSKIVGLRTVTYSNATGATDEQLPDEICSLDEDFALSVWTVVDSWADASEVSEHKSAGTAPWSSVRLMKTQHFQANGNIPRYLSDGMSATCMCLNNNQDVLIGTNSGLVLRCNLGQHKVWPSYYIYAGDGQHFSVNWLDICPFDSNYFLASCSNNGLILYRASRHEFLARLLASPDSPISPTLSIMKAEWCTGYPGIVFGLDSLSSIHIWDFCDDFSAPIMSVPFPGKTITSISLTSAPKNRNTYVGLSFANGATEMHRVKLENKKPASEEDHCRLLPSFLASL